MQLPKLERLLIDGLYLVVFFSMLLLPIGVAVMVGLDTNQGQTLGTSTKRTILAPAQPDALFKGTDATSNVKYYRTKPNLDLPKPESQTSTVR